MSADNTEQKVEPEQQQEGSQQQESQEPVDWEAKYRAALANSRKWEDRAKASYKDSEELKKLKEAQMTESEKTAKHVADLEQEVAAYKAADEQRQWRAEAAKKHGVPESLIQGATRDEMLANAKAISDYVAEQTKTPKRVSAELHHAKLPDSATSDDWLRRQFHKN